MQGQLGSPVLHLSKAFEERSIERYELLRFNEMELMLHKSCE